MKSYLVWLASLTFAFLLAGSGPAFADTRLTSVAVPGSVTSMTHTVTFDNDGALTKCITEYEGTATPPKVSMTGYIFLGWYTAKSGGVEVKDFSNVTTDATYYAQWRENFYTVKFIANGKTVLEKKVERNTSTTTPKSPARSGYKFMGWYTSTGKKFSSTKKITANVTYTALYYSTNANLYNLRARAAGYWGNWIGRTICFHLHDGESKVAIQAFKADAKAKVSWSLNKKKWSSGSKKTVNMSNVLKKSLYFKVKAQSGATKIYKVRIEYIGEP